LIALGIGAIIGAGLFVRTAAAAAQHAGPSVTIGFIVAAVGCAFAGLCYAEFASMIPIAGSAYTYSYATMVDFVAWIISLVLILTLLLIRGTKGSALVNALIVILKVAIVVVVIAIGWSYIQPANHTPFIPEPSKYTDSQGVTHNYGGILGILGAAGVVFFAF